MAAPFSPRTVLSAEDFHAINKLCNCSTETFDTLGNVFINAFSARRNSLAVGTALMHIFKEFDARTKIPQRLILLYFLYRVGDLDLSVDQRKQSSEELVEDALWHPFLSFFISLLEDEKENGSELVVDSLGSLPKANIYERYLLGYLLTGKQNDLALRTVNDLVQSVHRSDEMSEECPVKEIDMVRYKSALKQRHSTYPSLANASIPALIKLAGESREDGDEMFTRSLLDITCSPFMADVLPPSFHRVTPTLMPPSDDEFQFLYPFLLEPLWLDAETLKPDLNISTSCNHYKTANSVERSTSGSNENSTTTSQSKTVPTASKSVDDSHTESSSSRTPPSGMTITAQPAEPRRKWGASLPPSPRAPMSASSNESSVCRSSRTVSLSSLSFLSNNSADTNKSTIEDTSFTSESLSVSSSVTEKDKDKKPPLTHAEAVELMKKSLVSVIARTEAQRLSEAIAADGSIAEVVDIPISQYPKFIDDNPIVAAAVIVWRVNKNASELEGFFDLLLSMNLSVQGMEVVNKLCTQIAFPQDYLNAYILMCVQRCEDPSQSTFAQCRQVRMVCVFLSSLIRNGNWDVHPLSVELQSFVLKFNHVREAVSLYQAILVALQPPETANNMVTSSASTAPDSTASSNCESTTS
uniref:CCR4-NOT transcription complex subunit 11 n=1 Tax=Ascaris suum TaxID=6253 RepID=F1KYV8_ASCSU